MHAEINDSIQLGIEYDSNVFKTFKKSTGDSLFRTLFKSQSRFRLSNGFETGWNVQMGGKKYFGQSAKDVLIQYAEIPLSWLSEKGNRVSLISDFKYQNEDNSKEALDPSLPTDVNEDFFTPSARLLFQFPLWNQVSLDPFAQYTYFKFLPDLSYSYHLERGGVALRNRITENVGAGTSYTFQQQQFLQGSREDTEHELSAWLQYSGLPYASIRYTYQTADSTDSRFSFDNHKISLLFSIPFGKREDIETEVHANSEDPNALFVFHVLGTFQIKNFPTVFGSTAEGRRFLLTGAEDDNFNFLLVKLTYHPTPRFVVETKFNRYSNEFSSQPGDFTRYLVYGGIRYTF